MFVVSYGNSDNAPYEAQAKWVSDHLMIDALAGGAQKTTRVSQALEVLQSIIWSVRTGQLQDTFPDLELNLDGFDEQWKWMGSYASWRSAMLVLLYPENILLPTLRKRQTSAFSQLARELGSIRRLTPEHVRAAFEAHSPYYRDILSGLMIEASCQFTDVVIGARISRPSESPDLLYTFGWSSQSGHVYWSTYDPQKEPYDAQSLWDRVPGISDTGRIVGATPFYIGRKEYIYLFVQTREKWKPNLKFTRFDLETKTWAEEPTALELPKSFAEIRDSMPGGFEWVNGFAALGMEVVLKEGLGHETPTLALNKVGENIIYIQRLNTEGTGWAADINEVAINLADGPTAPPVPPVPGVMSFANAQLLYGFVGVGPSEWVLIHRETAPFPGVGIVYKFFERQPQRDLTPKHKKSLQLQHYAGHLVWPDTSDIFVFSPADIDPRSQDQNTLRYQAILRANPETPTPVASLPGAMRVIARSGFSRTPQKSRFVSMKSRPAEDVHEYRCVSIERSGGNQLALADGLTLLPLNVDYNHIKLHELTGRLERAGKFTQKEVESARDLIRKTFELTRQGSRSHRVYLEELFFFLPMQVALQLQQAGQYAAALAYLRLVYDYSLPPARRKIYHGLVEEESLEEGFRRPQEWLQDPLNPHAIAATRRNTYTRFTILALARCLLDYADSEFTTDTVESVARARTLYNTAQELLASPELQDTPSACSQLIRSLGAAADGSQWDSAFQRLFAEVATIEDLQTLKSVAEAVKQALHTNADPADKFAAAAAVVNGARPGRLAPPSLAEVLGVRTRRLAEAHASLLSQPGISNAVTSVVVAGSDGLRPVASFSVAPTEFCVPPNPLLEAARLRPEANLSKLRNGRNIAGMTRQLEPYAAPTNVASELPMVGPGGTLIAQPRQINIRPTPYRYRVLIARAKELAQLAGQVEAAMLAAIEKGDAKRYNIFKARQDVSLARAGVQLHDLRVREAEGGVSLAQLQQDRAQAQADHYKKLLDEGVSQFEQGNLDLLFLTASLYMTAAAWAGIPNIIVGFSSGVLIDWDEIMSNTARATSAQSSYLSTIASYERRAQDWEFQQAVSLQDARIGAQQVRLAESHVRVAGQEQVIAKLQAESAEAVLDFLNNEFTNARLYDWMSNVLQNVYSFFLQQATATAQTAASQLSFERQEPPPTLIRSDYWHEPLGAQAAGETDAPDRRGLTGSARLLQDIYQLDQYAFDTDKRKLQLTKTISLARLAPDEFQRLRDTGVMTFATPMELFDRDFPGHYLRLIRRVRVSVLALIPPTQGIRATLTTRGISRVVIGSELSQTTTIHRGPELIALSSPRDATGLFEMESQSDMLFPFEGIGVDTAWELRIPMPANLFDYRTLADVLLTIEYTALHSYELQQQVIQQMGRDLSADRPFSFRHEFADQWYDLHNPEQTSRPLVVKFDTHEEDFPVNIEDLRIQQVLLYFVRARGKKFEVRVSHLHFPARAAAWAEDEGAESIDGIISTRKGNASNWSSVIGKSPYGKWELALADDPETRALFSNNEIEDLLFVITYSGRTPEWPA